MKMLTMHVEMYRQKWIMVQRKTDCEILKVWQQCCCRFKSSSKMLRFIIW